MEKTKRMKLPLRSDSFTHTLPDELIEEILLRLPVRTLLRFKCVCKSWLALISNPQFAKSHYDIAAAPTHRLLVKPTFDSVRSVEIEAPLHYDSVVANPSPLQSSFNLLSNNSLDYLRILGSCRGFILLRYLGDDDLILWNPLTDAEKTISCSGCQKFLYGFGYDATTDDYLVVIAMSSHMEFFSVRTNSWNKTEGINFPYSDIGVKFRAGLLLNGALHWLTLSEGTGGKEVVVIIAFDLIKKSLSEIPLPGDFTASKSLFDTCHFIVLGGCLSLYCPGVCWVMKEYKVQSSWTKSIVSSNWYFPYNLDSQIRFAIGGVIVGSDAIGKLMKFDDKKERLEISTYVLEFFKGPLQSAIYTESLLSFPSDFGEAREDDQR